MNKTTYSNLASEFSLEIETVVDNEHVHRITAKLTDINQDNDKLNPLWIMEEIHAGVYQLTYEQILCRGLVMFGTLNECLNRIHQDADKKVARTKEDVKQKE